MSTLFFRATRTFTFVAFSIATLGIASGCNMPASFSSIQAQVLASKTAPPLTGGFTPDPEQPLGPCDHATTLDQCQQIGFSFDPKFNPFLSGMPAGTVALAIPGAVDDVADARSFISIGAPLVVAGRVLQFDRVGGHTANGARVATAGPDGENDYPFDRGTLYSDGRTTENGIRFLKAPANSLIGVFLSAGAPDQTPPSIINEADCPTDVMTTAARNRAEYKPALKQLFFIGDGRNDLGTVQKFVVPAGATRLFLANMDVYEWNNNSGTFEIHLQSLHGD